MKTVLLNIILLMVSISLYCQDNNIAFYIEDRGIYISASDNGKKKLIKYAESQDFYFTIKDDSTAIIQTVIKNKITKSQEYLIMKKIDTAYVKYFAIKDGKKVIDEIKLILFRRVIIALPAVGSLPLTDKCSAKKKRTIKR